MEEPHKQATMQRHTIFDRKARVTNRDQGRRMWFVQRHTISGEKNRIASTEKEKKANEVQRYTIPRRKTCVASTGRGKNKPSPHHNALHDTTIQHITTAQHKTPISTPDNTTNIQNTHTIPQTPYATPHTTKALPQKRRKSFIEIYQGQLGLEPTGVSNEPETRPYWIPEPTGGQNQLLHRSNYIVPDQPDPSTKYFKGPTRFKLQTVPRTNQLQAPTGFPNPIAPTRGQRRRGWRRLTP